jgi:hypothetical protein
MLLLRYRGPIVGISFLLLAALIVGCGSRRGSDDDFSDPGPMPRVGPATSKGDLGTPIKPGKAVLKGKITIDNPPDIAKLNEEFVSKVSKLASPADRPHCLDLVPENQKDQKQEQDWKVGSGNGLGQVFVYLRPAQDSYFALDPEDPRILAARKDPAVIDQPHCAYVPHATRLLPDFRDLKGNEEKKVQTLIIKNTAKIGHNVKFPDGKNVPLSSDGGEIKIDYLKADYTPLSISCSIHPWMNANILVLDHPYSAITNENGEYEIKNVPAGKMRVIVWHGKADFVTANKARGEEIEFKSDQTLVKDFEVKSKQ